MGSWVGDSNGGPMLWADNVFGRWTATVAKGTLTYLDSGRVPTAGAWQHVAATFDGLTARFYINGVEVASGDFTAKATSNDWRIGAYGRSRAGFRGVIDEVRVYARALSSGEIRTDMETPVAP